MEEERMPLELWRKIYNQRECKANKDFRPLSWGYL